MTILISLIIGVVILAVLVWAAGLLPLVGQLVRIIQAAVAIIGALLLAQRYW